MDKKWLGTNQCDLCGAVPKDVGDTCYDTPIRHGSVKRACWAFTCRPCWLQCGYSIGQEYDAKTLNKIRNFPGS